MNLRRLLAVAALAAAAGPTAACSGEADLTVRDVPAETLQEEVADRLEAEVGLRPDVTCTEDLPSEVGAVVTCDLHTDNGILLTTVTVTEVDEETGVVSFDILVDEQPAATP